MGSGGERGEREAVTRGVAWLAGGILISKLTPYLLTGVFGATFTFTYLLSRAGGR